MPDDPLVEVFLGGADGAVPVDIPGDFLANIGIGGGLGAIGQHAGFVQGLDPHLPVFAAHHRHGVVDIFLRGRLQVKVLDFLLVGIHPFLHGIAANRLEG